MATGLGEADLALRRPASTQGHYRQTARSYNATPPPARPHSATLAVSQEIAALRRQIAACRDEHVPSRARHEMVPSKSQHKTAGCRSTPRATPASARRPPSSSPPAAELAHAVAAAAALPPGGSSSGSSQWEGRSFFLQVERCYELPPETTTLRFDKTKYMQRSEALKRAVESFFDGQLHVEIVDVTTPFALEVRIMPDLCFPKDGVAYIGNEAEKHGAVTIFSKVKQKRWPQVKDLLEILKDFCRVSVRMHLQDGGELHRNMPVRKSLQRPRDFPDTAIVPQGSAINFGRAAAAGFSSSKCSANWVPVPHAILTCIHPTSGSAASSRSLITDTAGRTDTALWPGIWTLAVDDTGVCDKLSVDTVVVPARFVPVEVPIVGTVKKLCTFVVLDQTGKTYPRFPIKLTPLQQHGEADATCLVTKMDGCCRARLCRGVYLASFGHDGDASGERGVTPPGRAEDGDESPVAEFSQEIEVQYTDVPQHFKLIVQRVLFPIEILLEGVQGRLPFEVFTDLGRGVTAGSTNDIGLIAFEARHGKYVLQFSLPDVHGTMQRARATVLVFDDGRHEPKAISMDDLSVSPRSPAVAW
eukprot:TRINITY_DN28690_c0_g1_i1.p1 TRINITY_DN28690_c0_g1~~TRINITY_DN28690_c0_g1_i1.p1  ORF type:complete len:587 (+),score=99.44 TRINITY_DN28690_c0_g1_i1:128-1888(+)